MNTCLKNLVIGSGLLVIALSGCGGSKKSGSEFGLNEVCSGEATIERELIQQGFFEITAQEFIARIQSQRTKLWTEIKSIESDTSSMTTIQMPGASASPAPYHSEESVLVVSTYNGSNQEPASGLLCAHSVKNANGETIKSNSTSHIQVGEGMRLSNREIVAGWDSEITFDSEGKLVEIKHEKGSAEPILEWEVLENAEIFQGYIDALKKGMNEEGLAYMARITLYGNLRGQLAARGRSRSTYTPEKSEYKYTSSSVGSQLTIMEAL